MDRRSVQIRLGFHFLVSGLVLDFSKFSDLGPRPTGQCIPDWAFKMSRNRTSYMSVTRSTN